MKKIGVAIVLQNYLWNGNEFPVDKIKLRNGRIKVDQQDQLEYLMKFQNWLIEQQNNESQDDLKRSIRGNVLVDQSTHEGDETNVVNKK